jgi:hypothetical protein
VQDVPQGSHKWVESKPFVTYYFKGVRLFVTGLDEEGGRRGLNIGQHCVTYFMDGPFLKKKIFSATKEWCMKRLILTTTLYNSYLKVKKIQ